MELKMKTDHTNTTFLKSLFLSLVFVFVAFGLNAETKKDTLVNKAWCDTFKVVKAQIVDFDSGNSKMFYRPKPFQFVKNVPSDLYLLGKTAFSKKNLPKFGALLAGTALLVAVDQPILDASQQFGRYIHLYATNADRNNTKEVNIHIGGTNIPLMELPRTVNGAFYFIGEGWPSILLASGFYGYGLAANDYRARQTASQLSEMFITLGITCQFIKRISGRESPFRAMDDSGSGHPGGVWHPFPPPRHYQNDVSKHDAFPSGHLATAMATVTILSGNYPDNKLIKPIGYSMMGLLGYSMLNNGVHWISDYPLAIAIGYTCGKIALARGSKVIQKSGTDHGASSSLTPAYFREGVLGLSYKATF
jgi:hypothetical protein